MFVCEKMLMTARSHDGIKQTNLVRMTGLSIGFTEDLMCQLNIFLWSDENWWGSTAGLC